MKQGITITREYDHHDRPVVRITKRRGKLTLEEVSDLLRTEGWGEWNGYYAIVLNCSEGTLGDFMLRRAPPKWRHYALHAKRARVRKKYRNRIRRAFFAALASEGGGSS